MVTLHRGGGGHRRPVAGGVSFRRKSARDWPSRV